MFGKNFLSGMINAKMIKAALPMIAKISNQILDGIAANNPLDPDNGEFQHALMLTKIEGVAFGFVVALDEKGATIKRVIAHGKIEDLITQIKDKIDIDDDSINDFISNIS